MFVMLPNCFLNCRECTAFDHVMMLLSGRLTMTSWSKFVRWSWLAVVWTLPLHAMALEPVRYRCGSLGEVSVDLSRASSSKSGRCLWRSTLARHY